MEKRIVKFSIYTRLFVIVSQYIANILIPDHEADAFVYPQLGFTYTIYDKFIHHFFGGFLRWDAQYFLHIAQYGYTYENTLAFFPLYPLTVRLLSLALYLIFPSTSFDSILLLVFIILNIILFTLSAKVLFKLSSIFFDETVAYKSTFFFCLNPASIFFSAPYSECMFCYLTLQSIFNCVVLYKKYVAKTKIDYCDIFYLLPISLSLVVRSNGLLNLGFLVYTYICLYLRHWPTGNIIKKIVFLIRKLLLICFLIIFCLVPFICYQTYCYFQFCTNFDTKFPLAVVSQVEESNFVLPGHFSKYNQSWCYNKIPLSYSYVQSHYWNVGLLKYYELKQLPNFLLAAPLFIFVVKNSSQHLRHGNISNLFSFDKILNKKKHTVVIGNPVLNVFVFHILFLLLFCVFFVHIQVSTRMLFSASPVLYWFCASSFIYSKVDNFIDIFHSKMSWEQNAIIMYFCGYFLIGIIMFCNFLPWT